MNWGIGSDENKNEDGGIVAVKAGYWTDAWWAFRRDVKERNIRVTRYNAVHHVTQWRNSHRCPWATFQSQQGCCWDLTSRGRKKGRSHPRKRWTGRPAVGTCSSLEQEFRINQIQVHSLLIVVVVGQEVMYRKCGAEDECAAMGSNGASGEASCALSSWAIPLSDNGQWILLKMEIQ